MSNNGTHVETGEATAGEPQQRVEPAARAEAPDRPSREELDVRQATLRERRRNVPPQENPPEERGAASPATTPSPSVPPTDCAEPPSQ